MTLDRQRAHFMPSHRDQHQRRSRAYARTAAARPVGLFETASLLGLIISLLLLTCPWAG